VPRVKNSTAVKIFRAVLEKDNGSLGWTIVRLPFVPHDAWSEMVRLRVRGEIVATSAKTQNEKFPFRTSLFPNPGTGGFFLLVNRAMQAGAGVSLGSVAEFHLGPDLEPREAELPDELAPLLEEEPGLREWYDGLNEYTRREIGKWVLGVKSDEAKLRRAQQMAERLLSTKEAEVELPPILQAAFRLRPKASAGWSRMTETQRRNELMAVFYYQTPDARQRRIDKLLDAAEKH